MRVNDKRSQDLSQTEIEIHEDDGGLFVVLPADIVYDTRVSPEALRTYAIIAGFFRKSGYAFASNAWIAGKLKLHERSIQEHLNCLEENGYIVRETFNEGFKKRRRIWHPDAYRKMNSKNVAQTDVNSRIETDVSLRSEADVNSRYNNISINNTITPSPSSFANAHYEGSSPKGEKPTPPTAKEIERQPHVKTTEEEHARLVKDFGKEMVEAYYSYLSEWKKITPKKNWKLHDNLSIRRWVVDAFKEKALKKNPTLAISNNHRERAKKMHDKYPATTDLGQDYFISTTGAVSCGGKFGSPECENYLKKYGF